jgi:hypothetical protein
MCGLLVPHSSCARTACLLKTRPPRVCLTSFGLVCMAVPDLLPDLRAHALADPGSHGRE